MTLKIALAQLNFVVGDLEGNYTKIVSAYNQSYTKDFDLLIFSELAITGYPPEDLVLRPAFQKKTMEMVHKLAQLTIAGAAILIGSPWLDGKNLYNAAILLDEGKIKHVSYKSDLPNYGVFDEKRVFTTGPASQPLEFRGVKLGIMICEEMWNKKTCVNLKEQGAEILISINASPFESGKHVQRLELARQNVGKTSLPLIYVNQTGGQDELVFDGNSFVMSDDGVLLHTLASFSEDLLIVTWRKEQEKWLCLAGTATPLQEKHASIYNALLLGLKDYIVKNGFNGVVLGMSGGVDSALSAAIAVDALGADKVRLIMMPSKYTSNESLEDAESCAKLLGAHIETIAIEAVVAAFTYTLKETFSGTQSDTTEENLQSRIRGNILMAVSNKFGHMVLTTGNKSEMAVGYATLYGDMCGGFNVLKDLYKTEIYSLCKWRNQQNHVIPERIITKAPTAELKPNQTDQDTLPPYEELDKILYSLVELQESVDEISRRGCDPVVVGRVAAMVKLAEYKRRQAAPASKSPNLLLAGIGAIPLRISLSFNRYKNSKSGALRTYLC